jgi:glucose-1-phosphate cytidylyltransferase
MSSTRGAGLKVVIFCGGLGLRMRDAAPTIPKPMVPIGNKPILLHIMKYYAYFGHTEFILCLGHRAETIKEFFLTYNEALTNDFVLTNGGQVSLLKSDIQDWRITFVDTGLRSTVGERLKAVQSLIGEDELFLATYGDGLTDAPLPELIRAVAETDKVACFLCVRPTSYSFHTVTIRDGGLVAGFQDIAQADIWINGGFFVFRREIFDYLQPGEDLIGPPMLRLAERAKVVAHRYEGFWAPMDTLKDKHNLDQLLESGDAPWEVWEQRARSSQSRAS